MNILKALEPLLKDSTVTLTIATSGDMISIGVDVRVRNASKDVQEEIKPFYIKGSSIEDLEDNFEGMMGEVSADFKRLFTNVENAKRMTAAANKKAESETKKTTTKSKRTTKPKTNEKTEEPKEEKKEPENTTGQTGLFDAQPEPEPAKQAEEETSEAPPITDNDNW